MTLAVLMQPFGFSAIFGLVGPNLAVPLPSNLRLSKRGMTENDIDIGCERY